MLKLKNVAVTAMGSGSAQLLQLMTLMVIPFIYDGEQIASYFLFMSTVAVLSSLLSFNINHFYFSLNEEKKNWLLKRYLQLTIVLALVVCVSILLFQSYYWVLVVAASASTSIGVVLRSLLIHKTKHKKNSGLLLLRSSIVFVFLIVFSIFDNSSNILLAAAASEILVAFIVYFTISKYRAKEEEFQALDKCEILNLIKGGFQELMSSFVQNTPVLFAGGFLSATTTLYVGYVHRIIWPMVGIIVYSLTSALYSEISRIKVKEYYDIKIVSTLSKFKAAVIGQLFFVVLLLISLSFDTPILYIVFGYMVWIYNYMVNTFNRVAVKRYSIYFLQIASDVAFLMVLSIFGSLWLAGYFENEGALLFFAVGSASIAQLLVFTLYVNCKINRGVRVEN